MLVLTWSDRVAPPFGKPREAKTRQPAPSRSTSPLSRMRRRGVEVVLIGRVEVVLTTALTGQNWMVMATTKKTNSRRSKGMVAMAGLGWFSASASALPRPCLSSPGYSG